MLMLIYYLLFIIYYSTLDYIFLNGGWVVRRAEVLPHVIIPGTADEDTLQNNPPSIGEECKEFDLSLWTQSVSTSQPSATWPSDHFMLLAELELRIKN